MGEGAPREEREGNGKDGLGMSVLEALINQLENRS
jgi:hypothetical protein